MIEWILNYINVTGTRDLVWVGIGIFAQLMFSMRFMIQWIASEMSRKSVMPVAFWYFSLFGGLTLLAYGFYRGEPAIILGQLFGTVVYVRNLWLIHAEKRRS